MIDSYARVLEITAELEDKTVADAAVGKLIAHLRSSGRLNLLPQILRELRRIAARRHALRPRVEVASEKEAAATLRAAAEAGIEAPRASVNKALVRGWRAWGNGVLVDRSAKRALIDIYQKIIA